MLEKLISLCYREFDMLVKAILKTLVGYLILRADVRSNKPI